MSTDANSADPGSPALERRLATILSADVAGYSRMMGANEEATVQTLRGHRAVFDALLKQHRGRIFNTAGDAILAEFPSAVDAVRCATEIQTALQTRNEHLPAELKMQFRMGINLGDVVVQDGDLLGDGVNVASRIQTVAEPGGVCISGSVYDQIQNKLSLQFRPLGDQQFKNIGQPIRTFTITHGEAGALPVTARRVPARATALALAALAVVAVAAGGFALYRMTESKRSEQDALSKQVATERAAAEEARRTAELQSRRAQEAEASAEREKAAAEAARREAALQAQVQSAEDARRRAEADRKRIDEERQRAEAQSKRIEQERQQADADKRSTQARLEAEKSAADAARAEAEKKLALATAASPAVGSSAAGKFDGAYSGTMCNFPNNPARKLCWPVHLNVRNGISTVSWPSRIAGKRSAARLVIGADANASFTLDGWNVGSGEPLAGSMTGRVADNQLELQGSWANGAPVEGRWVRSP